MDLTEPAELDLLISEPLSDLEYLFQELKLLVQWCFKHNTEDLLGYRFLLRNDCHTFSEAVPIKAA